MPFKIVQTEERGQKILVVIPSAWEENGTLWWPPKKTQCKLVKDEYSKPKKEWATMDCTLKRSNIKGYQLAEAELELMEANSDTDKEVVSPWSHQMTIKSEENMKYELVANALSCDLGNSGTDCSNITPATKTTDHDEVIQIISTESFNSAQILENQRILSDKIDNVLLMQEITQQKTLQSLATLSVQLQEISLQLVMIKEGPSVTLLKDANPVDSESFTLKIIENQRDMISLDQLLADRAERIKLQKHLTFLCLPSIGKGTTCAYKLQEILFSKDFLCNCSWAGGSRGERSKIAFKDYKNVLSFFYGMIQIWDPTYTVQENEKFFKTITRNSQQRKSMKNVRMSSQRRRCTKKDNVDKEQKSGNTETGAEGMEIEEQEKEKENIPLNNMCDEEEDRKEIFKQQKCGNKRQPNADEKESEDENTQIKEHAPKSKETEGENVEIQEQSKETENFGLNNMDDGISSLILFKRTLKEQNSRNKRQPNADEKETDGEDIEIQEQSKETENIGLNNMDDGISSLILFKKTLKEQNSKNKGQPNDYEK